MALETGTLIPELDGSNPPGSDAKSQGDDHLRLIKQCVKGSFPAFTGTTAAPKSVALTEDQINDAALKSEAGVITGAWNFASAPVLDNGVHLGGRNLADDTTYPLVSVTVGDIIQHGTNAVNGEFLCLSDMTYRVNGLVVAHLRDRDTGSWLIYDRGAVPKKAGFRNPTSVAAGASRNLDQDDEGRILIASIASATYTAVTLEEFTTIRMVVSADGVTILPGATVSINVLDGSGSATPAASGIAILNNSIVELVYQTSTLLQVFGNGVSII